jgi:hypothetical protein
MFEVSYLLGKVLKQILPAGNQDSVTLTCFFHGFAAMCSCLEQ